MSQFGLVVLLLLAVLMIFGCSDSAEPDAQAGSGPQYDLEAIKKELQSGQAVLLDVRELDEWEQGHLKLSKHLAKSSLDDATSREQAVAELSKSKKIYTHCKMGGRATKCAQTLAHMGYQVTPLALKFEELQQAGL